VVAGLGVGSAFAFFTSHGSGSGAAPSGTVVAVTTASLGTPTSPLSPGSTGDVILKVTNSNSYAVTLTSVSGNGPITVDAGHSGCATTGVTFTAQTGLSTGLPGNGAVTTVDLSGAASMDSTSSSGCQGATFTVPVTIAVKK
jgi:hypothetical protein